MDLIFLTYINRSGSTYIAQILSGSDELLVCPEAEVLVQEFLEAPEKKFLYSGSCKKRLIRYLDEDWKLKHWGLKREDLECLSSVSTNYEAFRELLCRYRDRTKPGATKLLFKAERIIYLWKRLEMTLNQNDKIQLLTVIRDPRAIFASQKSTLWPESDKPFSQNPIQTSLFWCRFIIKILRLSALTNTITSIKFEDLLRDPEGSLDNLVKRIQVKKLSFQPENGDFYNRIPENQKLIHGNIKSQPIIEKENEWKSILNDLEIDLIQYTTRKEMQKMGYKLEKRKSYLFKLCVIKIPQVVAFYFNLYSSSFFFRFKKLIHGKDTL